MTAGTGPEDGPAAVVRSEEQIEVGTESVEAGKVRIRRRVESEPVDRLVERRIEQVEVEREGAMDGDSGEIESLPDGSISVPVFEERLVIEKRLVVRERIIIRKHSVTETQRVETELRRQRVEVDADERIAERVHDDRGPEPDDRLPRD